VDRQRPLTAAWLGLELPVALGATPPATLEVRQTAVKQMAEGARYEFEYHWKVRSRDSTPPALLNADVVGARDIRVVDMVAAEDKQSGTFAITTSKATEAARYDLYVFGRVKSDAGEEPVVARMVPFEVSAAPQAAAASQDVASRK
jgi:hypothetical protein